MSPRPDRPTPPDDRGFTILVWIMLALGITAIISDLLVTILHALTPYVR